MQGFTTKTGSWQTLKKYCKTVRLAVFVKEQSVPRSLEIDGLDAQCRHIVIFNEAQHPVATARFSSNGHFGRMAVLKAYRKRGIGNELLRQINQQARHLMLKQLSCHAQLSAEEFYVKNGFIRFGEPMEEAGIAHIKMSKDVNVVVNTLQ